MRQRRDSLSFTLRAALSPHDGSPSRSSSLWRARAQAVYGCTSCRSASATVVQLFWANLGFRRTRFSRQPAHHLRGTTDDSASSTVCLLPRTSPASSSPAHRVHMSVRRTRWEPLDGSLALLPSVPPSGRERRPIRPAFSTRFLPPRCYHLFTHPPEALRCVCRLVWLVVSSHTLRVGWRRSAGGVAKVKHPVAPRNPVTREGEGLDVCVPVGVATCVKRTGTRV
jgi:hypothetical protein